MSTKSSLVSGPSFHLFEECFDSAKNVWLELDGCEFEATPRGRVQSRAVVEKPV